MRYTTNELPSIDIRSLSRAGMFDRPGALHFKSRWLGKYSVAVDGPGVNFEGTNWSQHIGVSRTPCRLGGDQAWFICPNCYGRVAILYCSGRFACRKCHGLYYECQRTRGRYSALTKLQRIRERLGGSGNLSKPFPSRPKGMWRRTYDRMRDDAERLESEYVRAFAVRMKIPLPEPGQVSS